MQRFAESLEVKENPSLAEAVNPPIFEEVGGAREKLKGTGWAETPWQGL